MLPVVPVPYPNTEELTIKILLNDKIKSEEIVRRAFDYALKNHSIELIEKQLVDFFSTIPLILNNEHRWTEYKFDRINEKHRADYHQLQLSYQQQIYNHNALINNRIIKLFNRFREFIGKKAWE